MRTWIIVRGLYWPYDGWSMNGVVSIEDQKYQKTVTAPKLGIVGYTI
jgi:hypothetical protein